MVVATARRNDDTEIIAGAVRAYDIGRKRVIGATCKGDTTVASSSTLCVYAVVRDLVVAAGIESDTIVVIRAVRAYDVSCKRVVMRAG